MNAVLGLGVCMLFVSLLMLLSALAWSWWHRDQQLTEATKSWIIASAYLWQLGNVLVLVGALGTRNWGIAAIAGAWILYSLSGPINRWRKRAAKLIGAKARALRDRLVESMPEARTPALA